MTLWQAAAPASSLGFTLVGLVILLPVILGYTAWSYRVFRGKPTQAGHLRLRSPTRRFQRAACAAAQIAGDAHFRAGRCPGCPAPPGAGRPGQGPQRNERTRLLPAGAAPRAAAVEGGCAPGPARAAGAVGGRTGPAGAAAGLAAGRAAR
ncbi:hypothetical protein G6F50_012840 [Rhizopus delemar]|uniref:Uncharacterized protein n=1 Tax=Rhizopus delemar TaxID=936053 RepID=A0A9P6YRH7_9FUNG|nr:hypothetical protein G6F50_012840 [Rhizopus delemar]